MELCDCVYLHENGDMLICVKLYNKGMLNTVLQCWCHITTIDVVFHKRQSVFFSQFMLLQVSTPHARM